ncbi:TIGR02444 family protein [Bordetella sp. 02P26C-1]|uniref:TIGR02444 family protein n=1 Tax=unclassified Bordetella TaxID=2630031 RepID=UPI00136522DA
MPDIPLDLPSDAIALYGCEGVSEACLTLQERVQLDVNVLLFAAWMGVRLARSMRPQDIEEAAIQIRQWHREIVLPLRAVRRRLKTGPAPAPNDHTDALRAKVQSVEIAAELVELAQLGQLAHCLGHNASADASETAATNLLHVVQYYGGRPADIEERNAVNVIAAAATGCFS